MDNFSTIISEHLPLDAELLNNFLVLCKKLRLDSCATQEQAAFVLEFARVLRLRVESQPSTPSSENTLAWKKEVAALIQELSMSAGICN